LIDLFPNTCTTHSFVYSLGSSLCCIATHKPRIIRLLLPLQLSNYKYLSSRFGIRAIRMLLGDIIIQMSCTVLVPTYDKYLSST